MGGKGIFVVVLLVKQEDAGIINKALDGILGAAWFGIGMRFHLAQERGYVVVFAILSSETGHDHVHPVFLHASRS